MKLTNDPPAVSWRGDVDELRGFHRVGHVRGLDDSPRDADLISRTVLAVTRAVGRMAGHRRLPRETSLRIVRIQDMGVSYGAGRIC